MKKAKIYIDNNVWDILWNFKVDLNTELPEDEFELMITREAEFEFEGMPTEIRDFVEKKKMARNVKTDSYFGFYDPSLPDDEQRSGGFGSIDDPEIGGRFVDVSEYQFLEEEASSISTKKRKTGLFKNEADIALGARSLISIVLTCDLKGVLRRARNEWNGFLIDMKKFDGSMSLGNFVRKELAAITSTLKDSDSWPLEP